MNFKLSQTGQEVQDILNQPTPTPQVLYATTVTITDVYSGGSPNNTKFEILALSPNAINSDSEFEEWFGSLPHDEESGVIEIPATGGYILSGTSGFNPVFGCYDRGDGFPVPKFLLPNPVPSGDVTQPFSRTYTYFTRQVL